MEMMWVKLKRFGERLAWGVGLVSGAIGIQEWLEKVGWWPTLSPPPWLQTAARFLLDVAARGVFVSSVHTVLLIASLFVVTKRWPTWSGLAALAFALLLSTPLNVAAMGTAATVIGLYAPELANWAFPPLEGWFTPTPRQSVVEAFENGGRSFKELMYGRYPMLWVAWLGALLPIVFGQTWLHSRSGRLRAVKALW